MKHLFTLSLLLIGYIAQAQFLLNIDGETPDPFADKSGNNAVNTVGIPLNTASAVEFPTGSDYLIIDPFVDFDLDASWTVSFDIKVTNQMDSVFVIDWRSNSSVGHMHIGYNGNRGLYFSDRTVNGIYGSLVDDPTPLTVDEWTHFDVSRTGDSLIIVRNGTQVASSFFTGNLSELSTTTIGYSEDFRYDHASFSIDDLTVTASPLSVFDQPAFEFSVYPNPATDQITFNTDKKIDQALIYNVLGDLIATSTPVQGRCDLSGIAKGVYFLELRSEAGSSIQRFVKN